jgi:hypothetical protein
MRRAHCDGRDTRHVCLKSFLKHETNVPSDRGYNVLEKVVCGGVRRRQRLSRENGARTWSSSGDMRLAAAGSRIKLQTAQARRENAKNKENWVMPRTFLLCPFHSLVNLHDGGLVAAAVAVIGRGKDCHNIIRVSWAVPLHHKLMRSRDQVQLVGAVEHF